eukprot:217429-Prymnesium_polylepis.1
MPKKQCQGGSVATHRARPSTIAPQPLRMPRTPPSAGRARVIPPLAPRATRARARLARAPCASDRHYRHDGAHPGQARAQADPRRHGRGDEGGLRHRRPRGLQRRQ